VAGKEAGGGGELISKLCDRRRVVKCEMACTVYWNGDESKRNAELLVKG
jgi:hypothetical protein